MKLFIFLVVTIITVVKGASVGSSNSINSLLQSKNLFSEDLTLTRSSDVMTQLKNILSDATTLSEMYAQYKLKYRKDDERSEEKVFAQNLLRIAEHNLKFESGLSSWSMGVNKFTDMTTEYFNNEYTGHYIRSNSSLNIPMVQLGQYKDPAEVDWRQQGIVTPVKQQGKCSSCWSFAVVGILEAAIAKKTGNQLDLSEQELVDCNKENKGCQGGRFEPALNYLKKNGVVSEAKYGYTARDGTCVRGRNKASWKVRKWGATQVDENEFASAVAQYGPTGNALLAGGYDWQHYSGGIFDGECGSREDGHAISIVGYGNEGGRNYFIIKNSWGQEWGEDGFIKLPRGENKCEIGALDYAFVVSV